MTATPSLRAFLESQPQGIALLDQLRDIEPNPAVTPIPDGDALLDRLRYVSTPDEAIEPIAAARTLVADNEELASYLSRCVQLLRQTQSDVDTRIYFPDLPLEFGPIARLFWYYVYLTAVPDVRAYHARLGIPEEQTRTILADLGRNVRVAKKRYGEIGIAAPWWCALHLRGLIYQFGRLQYERAHASAEMVESMRAAGIDITTSDIVLSVHIPDFMGPFTPEAIDTSIAAMRLFFARFFPDDRAELGICYSWLLDDQLPDHLPPTSNIVRFQRRFTLTSQGTRDNSSTALFVWGLSAMPTEARENASSLERALIAHAQAGGSWGSGAGWTRLVPGAPAGEHLA